MDADLNSYRHFTLQVFQLFGFEAPSVASLEPANPLPVELEAVLASLRLQIALLALPALDRMLLLTDHQLLQRCLQVHRLPVEQWPETAAELGLDIVDWWLDVAPQTVQLDPEASAFSDELWFLQKTTEKVRPNPVLLDCFLQVLLIAPVFYSSLQVSLAKTAPELYNGYLPALGQQQPFKALPCGPEHGLALIQSGVLTWVFPTTASEAGWAGKLYQYLGFLEGGSSVPVIAETAFLLQWLRTAVRTLPFQETGVALETLQELQRQLWAYFMKYGKEPPGLAAEALLVGNPVSISETAPFYGHLETLRNMRSEIR